ncbi:MAG: YlxR family protein [Lachnospiraceae bacterium]|nr:YlxR family protein [Lachnospiraceae bacterium]
MKMRKTPRRKCMGCQEVQDKKNLIRVVRSPEGEISIDLTGRKAGRGAYLCPKAECLEKAIKTKALERSLEVTMEAALYDTLRKELSDDE